MDDSMKICRKTKKEKSCYLLTTSNSWVLDTVLPPTSSSMISAYTNTLQLEQKILIKEELDLIKKEDGNLTNQQRLFDCENHLKRIPTSRTGHEVGVEDTLYIKFEDNDETDENDVSFSAKKIPSASEGKAITQVRRLGDESVKLTKEDMNNHSISQPSGFICEYCAKAFRRQYNLLRHIHNVHQAHLRATKPTSGRHKCDICTNTYASYDGLKYHIRQHGRIKIDSGHKKHSKRLKNVKNVLKAVDNKCNRCGKCFADGGWLLQHEKFECYYVALDAVKKNKLGNARN